MWKLVLVAASPKGGSKVQLEPALTHDAQAATFSDVSWHLTLRFLPIPSGQYC